MDFGEIQIRFEPFLLGGTNDGLISWSKSM